MDYVVIIIFGLIIGSFLNVCICRIPEEESIAFPASHCTKCKHQLGILDLVPVFSYMFLRGRCRYCKEKISSRYPLIEILNALLYLIIYLKFGLGLATVKYCILASILIVIGMIDYKTQFVYTSTIIFGSTVGIVFIILQYVMYKTGVLDLILGGIIGLTIIGIIILLTKGMGEGDIEIAAMCGLFLGVKMILLNLFVGIVIGGVVGILIVIINLKDLKDRMAFGPFIAIGTIICILFGNEIITSYSSLFV